MDLQPLKHVALHLQGTTSMLATWLHRDAKAPQNSTLSEMRSEDVVSSPWERPEWKNKPESSRNRWFLVDDLVYIYNEASTAGTESSSSSTLQLLANNKP
jgi:hypothetical protein